MIVEQKLSEYEANRIGWWESSLWPGFEIVQSL